MNATETRELLRATAQGLLTLNPRDSHKAIAGLIRLVERAAETDLEAGREAADDPTLRPAFPRTTAR